MTDSSNDKRIAHLKKQMEFERSEERRNVELFQPLVRRQDELTSSILSSLFNRGEIKRLSAEAQRYADIANQHQRRANELERELRDLERA